MTAAGSRVALHLRASAERAVKRGHPWVYAEGMALFSKQGHLVVSSCTSRVTGDRLRALVQEVVAEAGRTLQVVKQTGHPLDHPIAFPEGAYLKCIFARVRP